MHASSFALQKIQHYSMMMSQLLLFSPRSSSCARLGPKRESSCLTVKIQKGLTLFFSKQSETGSCGQVEGGQAKQKADTEQGNVCLCQLQCSKLRRGSCYIWVNPGPANITDFMPNEQLRAFLVSSILRPFRLSMIGFSIH